MRLMGASEEQIAAIRDMQEAHDEDDDDDDSFAVFADNWTTFLFFVSLRTRWKVVAMPSGRLRRVGLNWLEVESKVNRTTPRRDRTALLDVLEVLEREALDVFAGQET